MAGTKYKELSVSVSFRTGKHGQTHTFGLDAGKLPQSHSFEGLMLTLARDAAQPHEPAGPHPVNPSRIVGRGARRRKKVEITLPDVQSAASGVPTWKQYKLIPMPVETRSFFPPYGQDFIIRSIRGDFVVAIKSAHNGERDKYRGGYVSKGGTALISAHRDLQPGDVLVFTKDGQKDVNGKMLDIYKMTVRSVSP